MERLLFIFSLLLWFSVFGLMGCKGEQEPLGPQYISPGRQEQPSLIFAVHPLHNPRKLLLAYQPLVDYLNTTLNTGKIVLEPSMNYAAYEAKFGDGRLAILLPNPFQTLLAMDAGFEVIAMAGERADFRGIFIARKDSAIHAVKDLRGKVVSYPAPTALAACVMPQFFLHQHGLNVQTDITNIYVGSQASSIMSAVMGKSAVAATWPPPWRHFQKDYPVEAEQLHVIWETPPLINNSVMVKKELPQAMKRTLQQSLLQLHQSKQGQAILKGIETSRFYAASNTDYEEVRSYIHTFEQQVRLMSEP